MKKGERALDWLPFNVVDWLTSTFVACLSLPAQGVYIRLLAVQWRDGYITDDVVKLARLCGCSAEEFAPIWAELSEKFEAVERGVANPRLEKDRTKTDELRLKRAEAGRKGLANRWQTDSKPIANEQQTDGKQIANASQTDSEREKEKEKEKEKEGEREARANSDRLPVPHFRPPTEEEVRLAMVTNHGLSESQAKEESAKFWNYFESVGWIVGKSRSPMKNWHAAVTTWVARFREAKANTSRRAPPPNQRMSASDVQRAAEQALEGFEWKK
jgi:uncharacterized protein YdaU (DUF1376 family)